MRVGSALRIVMVTSRAALQLPPFDQAPSPHLSTGEGFNQGPELRHVFFLLKFFAIVCLSHPHLYSQPSFFYYNDSNNSVHEFFVFLASPSARYLF